MFLSRFNVSEIVAVKNYMKKVNPVRHSASQSLNLVGQTRNLVRHASGKFSSPIIKFGSRNLDSALENTNSANPYIFPIRVVEQTGFRIFEFQLFPLFHTVRIRGGATENENPKPNSKIFQAKS